MFWHLRCRSISQGSDTGLPWPFYPRQTLAKGKESHVKVGMCLNPYQTTNPNDLKAFLDDKMNIN